MAHVEGGAFICTSCDPPVTTESVGEWNKHCSGNPRHYEFGETLCTSCGQKVIFDKLPFHPIDEKTGSKNISLRCEDCDEKMMGQVKRTSIKQVEAKQK